MAATILIVDDEKSVLKALRMTIEGKYRVVAAEKGSEALRLFQKESPDVTLLDIGLRDMDGMDVLHEMKKMDPDAAVIMVTAVDDVKIIVEAVRCGAHDYLVKPVNSQELLLTVKNVLENKQLKDQIKVIQHPEMDRYKFDLIGKNKKIEAMVGMARKVSKSVDTPILITGESGSGKGVLARAIHYSGKEAPGPFVTVNCGAIAKDLVESELFGYERGAFTSAKADGKKGRFEESTGGTLFLDEIGAMPLSSQAKLLSVLEDRAFYRVGGTRAIPLGSRVISATNADLEKAVEKGLFRGDLFYRINVVKLEVPALRDRSDDILLLAEHFISIYNGKFGKRFSEVSSEAKTLLMRYAWPGNVRELRNVIERIILLENGSTIHPDHLPFALESENIPEDKAEFDIAGVGAEYREKAGGIIQETLSRTNGNVTEASKLLNLPVHKLRYRIKKLGLQGRSNL